MTTTRLHVIQPYAGGPTTCLPGTTYLLLSQVDNPDTTQFQANVLKILCQYSDLATSFRSPSTYPVQVAGKSPEAMGIEAMIPYIAMPNPYTAHTGAGSLVHLHVLADGAGESCLILTSQADEEIGKKALKEQLLKIAIDAGFASPVSVVSTSPIFQAKVDTLDLPGVLFLCAYGARGANHIGPDYAIRGDVKVAWIALGEGWNGENDPGDPDDEELLRFDFFRRERDGDTGLYTWVAVEDASYCTRFPVKATDAQKQAGLEYLLDEFYDGVSAGACPQCGAKDACVDKSKPTHRICNACNASFPATVPG